MELMDIRWCMASVIRRSQRFMEITGWKCLEDPDMKLGFDKAKVTCFKGKQKGHFKRECTNNKADESVNPFHEGYYKKAIYHRTNEQPIKTNQKLIDEGSSKDRKQAMVVIQDDEGFNWNKYIPKEKHALVAEFRQSREEHHARMCLSDVYAAAIEAKQANIWDRERECFIDPQRNPTVDPQKVDFKALMAAIPTAGVWAAGIEKNPNYRREVEEGIRKVIYASVEKKKKNVEEIVEESKKMVAELKKTTKKAGDEKLNVPTTEVRIQTESSASSNKIDNQTDE
ncbi:putative transcription factor interactor and regulator CCHC(Zn) family [Helianthus annuus]|nr:putative transcription factor interactor and regulator CCHC(Zn) family [Helianthus annuus]